MSFWNGNPRKPCEKWKIDDFGLLKGIIHLNQSLYLFKAKNSLEGLGNTI